MLSKIRYFHPLTLTQPSTTKQRSFLPTFRVVDRKTPTFPRFSHILPLLPFNFNLTLAPLLSKTCMCAHPSNISSFISAPTEKDGKNPPLTDVNFHVTSRRECRAENPRNNKEHLGIKKTDKLNIYESTHNPSMPEKKKLWALSFSPFCVCDDSRCVHRFVGIRRVKEAEMAEVDDEWTRAWNREQENRRHKTSNWIWLHRWALLKLFVLVRQRMMCVVWTSAAHTCATKRCLVFMEHWVQFENSPFARSHFHSSLGTLPCAWVKRGQEQRSHETFFFARKIGILHRHCTTICERFLFFRRLLCSVTTDDDDSFLLVNCRIWALRA